MLKPIIIIHRNLKYKYENIDFLDLIESNKCTQKVGQQSEFHIGCSTCRLSNIKRFKHNLKDKLEDLTIQAIGYKTHFRKPCFNCSSSFHGSIFEDGHFNLQKMFKIDKDCNRCQRKFTTERSFHHNCNMCNISFMNCTLLVHHRATEHNSKKPHQCAVCHLSFSEGAFYRHIYKHKRPHICQYCNKRFASKFHLESHILSHTGESPFSCKYCPKKFKSKQGLDLHLFQHTGGKKFKCDLCDKTYATQTLLTRHNLNHIKKSIHKEKPFKCKYCPKQYTTKYRLEYHLFEHTGGKEFQCCLCDKILGTAYSLEQHKRVHMKKSFQCIYCPKQYKSKHSLNVHLFEHTGVKEFKCDVCDKTFAKSFQLNQHKLIHMEKLFQCKYCSKKYTTKQCLDVHLVEHTVGKKFKCDSCDKSFIKENLLIRHKSTHRQFNCDFCGQSLSTRFNLQRHTFLVH